MKKQLYQYKNAKHKEIVEIASTEITHFCEITYYFIYSLIFHGFDCASFLYEIKKNYQVV